MSDFTFCRFDTVFLFTPVTVAAREWTERHVDMKPWQWLGGSFGIEARYVVALIEGIKEAGLTVAQ